VNVQSLVGIYKIDWLDTPDVDRPCITVESVGQYSKMITLIIDGKKYEVSASELQKAIQNALNC